MAHTEIIQPLRVVDKKPVDSKFICQDMDEALSLAYPGYICFIAATGKFYRFLANNKAHEWQVFNIEDFATRTDLQNEIAKLINGSPEVLDTLAEISAALNNDQNFGKTMVNELVKKVDKVQGMGLSENSFSTAEKTKLGGVEPGANNYTHPANHPASIITQDASNRFVSDTEKANWNAKASTAIATTSTNGLMASADKTKLDGIATGANNYTHPANHPASIITQDASNRFVTDAEKAAWNAKASTTIATTSANGLMSSADKTKLDNINSTGTSYTHPANHPASIITQDASNRFVSDAEKDNWNAKASTELATLTTNGLMGYKDKIKLEGVDSGANNYTHPPTHPASMIQESLQKRFVSADQVDAWNRIIDLNTADWYQDGLMSRDDKYKLDRVADYANNYSHPASHPASMITQDVNNQFVTDAEKAAWNDKYTKNEVENKLSALITALDWKEAVANFAALATTYPAPEQGWTVNVKDVNKTYTYNGSSWVQTGGAIPLATQSIDGLMARADKTKLDGIATGANNYTHPVNHPASMITQDSSNRFVSDAEKVKIDWIDETKIIHGLPNVGSNNISNPNAITKSGFYRTTSPPIAQFIHLQHATSQDYGLQIGNNYTYGSICYREKNEGVWGQVFSFVHSGNFKSQPSATTSANGLMASADKTKLDGIATGANNYTHPANHPASIITQDASNRFVTDAEKMDISRSLKVYDSLNGLENNMQVVDFTGLVKANATADLGLGAFGGTSTVMSIPIKGSTDMNGIGADGASLQLAFNNPFGRIYKRIRTGTTYSKWHEILTSYCVNDEYWLASIEKPGFMSAADKTKVDRISGGKVTVSLTQPTDAQLGDIWIQP